MPGEFTISARLGNKRELKERPPEKREVPRRNEKKTTPSRGRKLNY